jgi:DNA-binding XRE family transcriptional regulator
VACRDGYSALALLRWTWPPPFDLLRGRLPLVYDVCTLRLWPLGTSYTEIVEDVARFFAAAPLCGTNPLLAVDATGVGDAVYEMVLAEGRRRKMRAGLCGITITAGTAVTQAGEGRHHVAKRQLVSVLQVLLGNRRLRIARGLSQEALAERAGVGASGLTPMERGERLPRPRTLRKLAEALGVEAGELLPAHKGGAGVAPL